MGCNRARHLLFLWIDRDHESLPVGPLERHFGECPECREHAGRVERLVVLVRTRCPREAAPRRLVSRIRGMLELG
jgi:anti-sigma factor (TIGR02949 family)